jgi:hypothetical protein
MSMTASLAFAALALAPVNALPGDAQVHLAQAKPMVSTQGYVAPQGDYMTTAQGCTYRRTQAPGYPARWILVLNPHHLGLPNSPRSCKGMM